MTAKLDTVPVVELDEDELTLEFLRVMLEWGHEAFRQGDVRFPTLRETQRQMVRRRDGIAPRHLEVCGGS